MSEIYIEILKNTPLYYIYIESKYGRTVILIVIKTASCKSYRPILFSFSTMQTYNYSGLKRHKIVDPSREVTKW